MHVYLHARMCFSVEICKHVFVCGLVRKNSPTSWFHKLPFLERTYGESTESRKCKQPVVPGQRPLKK